jgi:hypothetical protein
MLFLVGVPRSGTTWLQTMLGNHPRICTAQESHIFTHVLGPILDNWAHMLDFDDGRGGIGLPAYLTESEMLQVSKRFAYEVFSSVEGFYQSEVFVEKTPDHILRISEISKIIPSARFVLISREPRDVVESLLAASRGWGHRWAPRSTLRAARLVSRYTRAGIAGLNAVPESSWIAIRYENLRANPGSELERVLRFADLDYTEEELDMMLKKRPELRRHGEFARLSGEAVIEPKGFRRERKERLSLAQKALVELLCREPHRELAALT